MVKKVEASYAIFELQVVLNISYIERDSVTLYFIS